MNDLNFLVNLYARSTDLDSMNEGLYHKLLSYVLLAY